MQINPNQRPCARLVQLTDLHWLSDPTATQRGMNTRTSFLRILDAARPIISRADALLLTGDIAQDELSTTYQALKPYLLGLQTPIWTLPGNHDVPDAMAKEFGQSPYAYLSHHELNNWLIVMLDSHWPGNAAGRVGDAELQRLELTVANSTAEHVLVCLHHHPLPLGSTWLDAVALTDASALCDMLRTDARYRAVVYGHVHQAHDQFKHGLRWLACPSTNAQFTPAAEDFNLDSRPPGFRWLNLYADGQVHTDVVWLNPSSNVAESVA